MTNSHNSNKQQRTKLFFQQKPVTQVTGFAHFIWQGILANGDHVLDATMGNGQDCIYLLSLIGSAGTLYATDIQPRALMQTRRQLRAIKGLKPTIHLRLESHTQIAHWIPLGTLRMIIFNLGYLPQADHQICTQAKDTLIALEQSWTLLQDKGYLSIACYKGHDESNEYHAVYQYLMNLDASKYKVLHIQPHNQNQEAPSLFLCQKWT